ncbi:hypothetical protein I6F30_03730 [Bradyrhizobium sp. NBAIM20]|uniref:hypothetical protein n=1 Tax=unclassified Bradyrhizobium TaxID=2631580 RepID=UPI001CD62EF3|nr:MULTISPECIES: hypothetical protein [unclassified Bradyrhizobium]MCA1410278.1 hypothetical protein [Bradyrhizobium sp. NBAIM20]MCA1462514.1 hypothetical protein [Bradyrhizobium sp. NBAIM18]
MFCLTPFPAHQFDKLIDRSESARKVMKNRGHLKPLIAPSPKQRADGLWREQVLIAADAIIITAIDLLMKAGAMREAVDGAMNDIQFSIVSRLGELDDGKNIELGFGYEIVGERFGKHFAVVTAATMIETIQLTVNHFQKEGVTDANKLAFFCIPLREAYDIVRTRAKQHNIDFPARIWPTPEEVGADAAVLAAAIGPRTSPVIYKWSANRCTAEVLSVKFAAKFVSPTDQLSKGSKG